MRRTFCITILLMLLATSCPALTEALTFVCQVDEDVACPPSVQAIRWSWEEAHLEIELYLSGDATPLTGPVYLGDADAPIRCGPVGDLVDRIEERAAPDGGCQLTLHCPLRFLSNAQTHAPDAQAFSRLARQYLADFGGNIVLSLPLTGGAWMAIRVNVGLIPGSHPTPTPQPVP